MEVPVNLAWTRRRTIRTDSILFCSITTLALRSLAYDIVVMKYIHVAKHCVYIKAVWYNGNKSILTKYQVFFQMKVVKIKSKSQTYAEYLRVEVTYTKS